jgi:hypothetical protein
MALRTRAWRQPESVESFTASTFQQASLVSLGAISSVSRRQNRGNTCSQVTERSHRETASSSRKTERQESPLAKR